MGHLKIRNTVKQLLCLLFLSCLVSCNGPSEPEQEFVGPIPKSEYDKVSPPSFADMASAFDKVATKNPGLVGDGDAFTIAVFEEVKIRQGIDAAGGSLGPLDFLTRAEWDLVILDTLKTFLAFFAVDDARSAGEQYGCGIRDGKADAVRHAFWNALMVYNLINSLVFDYTMDEAIEFASDFGTAHESETTEPRATAMDLSNNAAGRKVIKDNPQATPEQLLQLILALPFEFVEADEPITFDAERLVYFEGKSEFDGVFVGTLTNPDSAGGPWNATFTFNQCTTTIRGGYTITWGASFQKRRFSGEFIDGEIKISISDPFEYEIPPDTSFCTRMAAVLVGNEFALSGNWTSSNCRSGGTITLSSGN
jgi:hypothetical protein